MWRIRANTVLAVALALTAGAALPAERTVSWTNPTRYTDGTSLSASDIDHTTIVWGSSQTALTNAKTVQGAATSTTLTLAPGTWFIAAKTTAKGTDSALTSAVQVTIAQPAPEPPSNLTVQQDDLRAYQFAGVKNSMILNPVGEIPTGTACNAQRFVSVDGKTYYVVDRSAVAWYGSVKPQVTFARCNG